MKSVTRFFAAMLCCFFLAAASAGAQQVLVDLDKIDPRIVKQIVEAKQELAKHELAKKEKKVETIVTVDRAKEWANIGENVAKAIAATAKALSLEVNDFVKTPVGKWTLFFVFWYIIGKTIWTTTLGLLIWVVLGVVIWKSFKTFHIPKIEEVEVGGKKEKRRVYYEFHSRDARSWSAGLHVFVFIVLSIVMVVILL